MLIVSYDTATERLPITCGWIGGNLTNLAVSDCPSLWYDAATCFTVHSMVSEPLCPSLIPRHRLWYWLKLEWSVCFHWASGWLLVAIAETGHYCIAREPYPTFWSLKTNIMSRQWCSWFLRINSYIWNIDGNYTTLKKELYGIEMW